MDNKIKAKRGIEKIVKSLPRDLHCENAINELYVRQALISQAEKHHQQLQKAREEQNTVLLAYQMSLEAGNVADVLTDIKNRIKVYHSELDQDVSK